MHAEAVEVERFVEYIAGYPDKERVVYVIGLIDKGQQAGHRNGGEDDYMERRLSTAMKAGGHLIHIFLPLEA
jgi:hypothetical protein